MNDPNKKLSRIKHLDPYLIWVHVTTSCTWEKIGFEFRSIDFIDSYANTQGNNHTLYAYLCILSVIQ